MAIAIKVLGNASIGATQTGNDLLTAYSGNSNAVPNGKAVIVSNIRLVNTGTVTRTVSIKYLPAGTNARVVCPKNVPIPPSSALVLDEELMLVATDKLQVDFGETGTSIIDVVVGGVERDA